MVPPFSVLLPSGMKMMTGCSALAVNSSDTASLRLQSLRAASMTATCMPRQIPSMGIFLVRAQLAALIMPSVAREPKPPGIRMPSAVQTSCQALWYFVGSASCVDSSRCSESTHLMWRAFWHLMAECSSALVTER